MPPSEDVVTNTPETMADTPPTTPSADTVKEPNESLLGGMLVGVFVLLLLILIATFGYFGYRMWRTAQVERAIPSIQELGEKPQETAMEESAQPSETETPAPAPEKTETPSTLTAEQLAQVEVKVLNGGARGGSASTLTNALKKAGYTKAAYGNTVADYTGTTIYYTAEAEAAATALKTEVAKTYPNIQLMPAKAGDKDATAAAVVVILGK